MTELSKNEIEQALNLFKDSSGGFKPRLIRNFFENFTGHRLSMMQLKDLLQYMDFDNDGRITVQDFKKFMGPCLAANQPAPYLLWRTPLQLLEERENEKLRKEQRQRELERQKREAQGKAEQGDPSATGAGEGKEETGQAGQRGSAQEILPGLDRDKEGVPQATPPTASEKRKGSLVTGARASAMRKTSEVSFDPTLLFPNGDIPAAELGGVNPAALLQSQTSAGPLNQSSQCRASVSQQNPGGASRATTPDGNGVAGRKDTTGSVEETDLLGAKKKNSIATPEQVARAERVVAAYESTLHKRAVELQRDFLVDLFGRWVSPDGVASRDLGASAAEENFRREKERAKELERLRETARLERERERDLQSPRSDIDRGGGGEMSDTGEEDVVLPSESIEQRRARHRVLLAQRHAGLNPRPNSLRTVIKETATEIAQMAESKAKAARKSSTVQQAPPTPQGPVRLLSTKWQEENQGGGIRSMAPRRLGMFLEQTFKFNGKEPPISVKGVSVLAEIEHLQMEGVMDVEKRAEALLSVDDEAEEQKKSNTENPSEEGGGKAGDQKKQFGALPMLDLKSFVNVVEGSFSAEYENAFRWTPQEKERRRSRSKKRSSPNVSRG